MDMTDVIMSFRNPRPPGEEYSLLASERHMIGVDLLHR